ncbi:MAG: RidA family protein [Thermoplasmata archaeon]|uniref:RidA family protein n=1 Tax=Candidatus Sysuiplasma superficiale TaxID=2823368 RepID=A0A8J7YQD8_9ARCH|nr:RidA family protein [Candidatus Sysuiplasma superficiale]MBX8643261.1 RidA family protein [Candidatus Sysuiplasma superficiale]MCL4346970.1 RidA family protein [Candidatus Thermoplasmatota archaeon]
MTARQITTADAPAAIGPYSQALVSGKLLFCSGQLGLEPGTGTLVSDDVEEQTERCILNMEAILKSAGFSLEDVVKTTIFLTDMSNFDKVNRVYSLHFGSRRPARSTVGVASLPRKALVEIEAVAVQE